MSRSDRHALAERVRTFIGEHGYDHNQRLPPERELCALLDVSRSQLRNALAVLEENGLIWRHVGRGTFIGARPVLNLDDITFLRELASPEQILESRTAIEPALAQLAAMHGTKADLEEITACAARCRNAADWRSYEAWDNNLHDAIAKATHNKLLIYLFETLNVVRRTVVWGQTRTTRGPKADHVSFKEHDAIIAAIKARDADQAASAMLAHLRSVRERVLPMLILRDVGDRRTLFEQQAAPAR
jgi:DNA-binding FadR family transcriptional regulator